MEAKIKRQKPVIQHVEPVKIKRQKPVIQRGANWERTGEGIYLADIKEKIKMPKITFDGEVYGFESDVRSMLYALLLICGETGKGILTVDVRNGAVYEMSTTIKGK